MIIRLGLTFIIFILLNNNLQAEILCITKFGTVRQSQNCKQKDRKIIIETTGTINGGQGLDGASGAQGPKGDMGPQGPKGDTGPQGPGSSCSTENLHSYKYQYTSAPIGAEVIINGSRHKMVRVPFKEYKTGDHYSITYPSSEIVLCGPSRPCDSGTEYVISGITTSHSLSREASECSNTKISGYDGHYYLYDYRYYRINSPSFKLFNISESATLQVEIQINETRISISKILYKTDYTPITVRTDDFDYIDNITWNSVTHPDIELNSAREFMNHIKIEKIN